METTKSVQEITPQLQWCKGVLQQAWNVTHYKGGIPHNLTTEWRDVPTTDDAGQRGCCSRCKDPEKCVDGCLYAAPSRS